MSDVKEPLYLRWAVLDHLLKTLNKKYGDIPKEIIKDLQYARALTNFYTEDPSEPDRAKELGRIDSLLNTVERNLMSLAQVEGEEFVKEWEEKLLDASKGKEVFKSVPIQSKFIAGMPANFDFVRFNFRQPIAEERFIEICEYENVIIEFDDNDKSVFIFGEKPNITSALKEMGPFFSEQI
ncbi:DUF2096 family protein [Methanosphaera sp.]